MNSDDLLKKLNNLDAKLSKRYIDLDPKGYFIIKVDLKAKKIIVEHYLNNIDKEGIALDPMTNKPIECSSREKKRINQIFSGSTAKEVGISITENHHDLISKFDHALYIGRELQKAEESILKNITYIQD